MARRGVTKTPIEQKETITLKALAADISKGLSRVKKSGNNIKNARVKKSLSMKIGFLEKVINNRHKSVLGDIPSWQYMNRKVRSDALSDDDSQAIYDYWMHQASRPTGDKNVKVKQHINKGQNIKHTKHVL